MYLVIQLLDYKQSLKEKDWGPQLFSLKNGLQSI